MYSSIFFGLICTINPYFFSFVISKHDDEAQYAESLSHIQHNDVSNEPLGTSKVDGANKSQPFQNAPLRQNEGMKGVKAISEENTDTCPSGVECKKLGGECLNCNFNKSCVYGNITKISCEVKKNVHCNGDQKINHSIICRYCYQTEKWEHSCKGVPRCRVTSAPPQRYIVNCSVNSDIICLGNRKFQKNILCNWTSGYRWSTALILSITLGGFGADRFYLGHWQEGIGKLFSFGGLGVWTVIDVVLVAIGYVGPADGSLYIWNNTELDPKTPYN